MTVVTVIIKDNTNEAGDHTIEMEGHMEPKNAIDLPPTPALIVGSYLAANSEAICKDAMQWFQAMSAAPQVEEAVIATPKLYVPDSSIQKD